MRVADAARAGFAIGYAQSTALWPVGLSESARITLEAAIKCAEADPRLAESIVEATLELGKLEGVWAAIFDRRLKLIDDGTAAVVNAWKAAAPDFTLLAREFGPPPQLGETIAPPDPQVAAAVAALLADLHSDEALIEVVAEWIRNAEAEGKVTALALAADEADAVGFDFNLAFEDAYQALTDLEAINSQAIEALVEAGKGTANDLGRALSALVRDGASYDELLGAAEDLFTTARAAAYYVDVALAAGMNQGAVNLYQSEGVTQVDWVTAGDGRVCAQCDGMEQNNPYPVGSPDLPPAHGGCRCCVTADSTGVSADTWLPYTSSAD